MFTLPIDKIRRITLWRQEVHSFESDPLSLDCERKQRHQGYAYPDAINPCSPSPNSYRCIPDDYELIDQQTLIFEGDRRLQTLPHPDCNQLMSLDSDLIEEEYCRVLHLWNTFEAEKWRAEKTFLRTSSYEVLQDVFNADLAVRTASAAAKYMEDYAQHHRLPINFQTLFFRIYKPPAFDLCLADDSDVWNAGNSHYPQPQPPSHIGQRLSQGIPYPNSLRGIRV